MYADLTRECKDTVKVLAKQIRDHVMCAIEEEEGRPSLLVCIVASFIIMVHVC